MNNLPKFKVRPRKDQPDDQQIANCFVLASSIYNKKNRKYQVGCFGTVCSHEYTKKNVQYAQPVFWVVFAFPDFGSAKKYGVLCSKNVQSGKQRVAVFSDIRFISHMVVNYMKQLSENFLDSTAKFPVYLVIRYKKKLDFLPVPRGKNGEIFFTDIYKMNGTGFLRDFYSKV